MKTYALGFFALAAAMYLTGCAARPKPAPKGLHHFAPRHAAPHSTLHKLKKTRKSP